MFIYAASNKLVVKFNMFQHNMNNVIICIHTTFDAILLSMTVSTKSSLRLIIFVITTIYTELN